MPAARGWSPLLYRRPGADHAIGVGFISVSGPDHAPRTVVTLDNLPDGSQVSAHEVTEAGPRHVSGRLADNELVQTHAAPLYLYRLTA
jgi:hypothetical protein